MKSIWIESSKCNTSSYHPHLHIYRTYNGLFSTNACFVGKEVTVNRLGFAFCTRHFCDLVSEVKVHNYIDPFNIITRWVLTDYE